MIKLDTQQDVVSLIVEEFDNPMEIFLNEDEAWQLMNDLYNYFENKDREAIARYLTRGKKPGTL